MYNSIHLLPILNRARRLAIALLGVLLAALPAARANTMYTYSMDTSAFAGTQGYLAFDFAGSDDAGDNNTLTVANLVVTGGALDDASDFVLAESGAFTTVERAIGFGSSLSFTFGLSENFGGGSFDGFWFTLFDLDYNPLGGSDHPYGAALNVDITGDAGGIPNAFLGNLAPYAPPVPDTGGTLALGGLACGLLIFARRFGARRMAA